MGIIVNILTLRTDNPKAEVGLYRDGLQLDYIAWEAHRMLAETISSKINELIEGNDMSLGDIQGIICYRGPGSFTGLRIGLSVANALAYSLSIPIVGIEAEQDWISRGLSALISNNTSNIITPEYGAPVHITQPKK